LGSVGGGRAAQGDVCPKARGNTRYRLHLPIAPGYRELCPFEAEMTAGRWARVSGVLSDQQLVKLLGGRRPEPGNMGPVPNLAKAAPYAPRSENLGGRGMWMWVSRTGPGPDICGVAFIKEPVRGGCVVPIWGLHSRAGGDEGGSVTRGMGGHSHGKGRWMDAVGLRSRLRLDLLWA